jgi:hypothetical protein
VLLTYCSLRRTFHEGNRIYVIKRGRAVSAARLAYRELLRVRGMCVLVTQRDGLIILRDSTRPGGITLPYAAVKWQSFVAHTKAGKFDNLGF